MIKLFSCWVFLHAILSSADFCTLFCRLLILSKLPFSKHSFRKAIRVSNSLDLNRALHSDLGPNCSVDDKLLLACIYSQSVGPRLEVIKLFSCSTLLSMKLIILINVKMPTTVDILTFISIINTTSLSLKARNAFIFQHFCFYSS